MQTGQTYKNGCWFISWNIQCLHKREWQADRQSEFVSPCLLWTQSADTICNNTKKVILLKGTNAYLTWESFSNQNINKQTFLFASHMKTHFSKSQNMQQVQKTNSYNCPIDESVSCWCSTCTSKHKLTSNMLHLTNLNLCESCLKYPACRGCRMVLGDKECC